MLALPVRLGWEWLEWAEAIEPLERESELVRLLRLHMLDLRDPLDGVGELGGVCGNNQIRSSKLKTLFNIVEDRFKKLLNFDVCVV